MNAQGFDFICYSGDVWVLQQALTLAMCEIRAGAAKNGRIKAKSAAEKSGAKSASSTNKSASSAKKKKTA